MKKSQLDFLKTLQWRPDLMERWGKYPRFLLVDMGRVSFATIRLEEAGHHAKWPGLQVTIHSRRVGKLGGEYFWFRDFVKKEHLGVDDLNKDPEHVHVWHDAEDGYEWYLNDKLKTTRPLCTAVEDYIETWRL